MREDVSLTQWIFMNVLSVCVGILSFRMLGEARCVLHSLVVDTKCLPQGQKVRRASLQDPGGSEILKLK